MSREDLFGAEPELSGRLAAGGILLLLAGGGAEWSSRVRGPDRGGALHHAAAFILCAAGAVSLIVAAVLATGDRPKADVAWQSATLQDRTVWTGVAAFMRESGAIAIQGFILSFLQICILGSICVSLAAFAPPVVSVSATALAYMIGNLSSYLLASVEGSRWAGVRVAGRAAYYLLPNLGYFNLQTHFAEGSILSLGYMGLALLHAILYSSIVFLVSCTVFERGEIK